ncbi:MAG TPA: ATP-dependent Clp protease adaptor ClpS [Tepidisphaeraceae bacterium]|jgi:ATP-dependent Clp protease adapter protein ClpS|nr:ATP-dependent Clp protease adaptor ClpS [Tepidisphaeraceae bacterium]
MQFAIIIVVGAALMAAASLYQSRRAGQPWLANIRRHFPATIQTLMFWATFVCFAFASRDVHPRRRVMLQLASFVPAAVALLLQTRASVEASRKNVERKRLSEGLCVACGYDLRHSREHCPECGLAVPRIVILHNDDKHTSAEVVAILQNVPGLSADEAQRVTGEVHLQGQSRLIERPPPCAAEICRKLEALGLRVSTTTRAEMAETAPAAGAIMETDHPRPTLEP